MRVIDAPIGNLGWNTARKRHTDRSSGKPIEAARALPVLHERLRGSTCLRLHPSHWLRRPRVWAAVRAVHDRTHLCARSAPVLSMVAWRTSAPGFPRPQRKSRAKDGQRSYGLWRGTVAPSLLTCVNTRCKLNFTPGRSRSAWDRLNTRRVERRRRQGRGHWSAAQRGRDPWTGRGCIGSIVKRG